MTRREWLQTLAATSCAAQVPQAKSAAPYRTGKLLFRDDFAGGLSGWVVEQTAGGTTKARDGKLEIDGGGCTVWFKPTLAAPVMIEYVATCVEKGGPNDNCRDLNCFWMARHPKSPHDLFNGYNSSSESRGGNFARYHDLRTYYAGYGGHQNTTSRFRRYTGFGGRPLLPEHDLSGPRYRIRPNTPMKIQVIACGEIVQWLLDGETIFDFRDPFPYTSGWFGFRTVSNHMTVEKFRVYSLTPETADDGLTPSSAQADRNARALGLSHGLHEAARRHGWRRLEHVRRGGGFLSERTVFHDPKTGGLVWRVSCDPSCENNEYTDIPVWSADGATMLFITNRRGEAERWLMDADGANLRPIPETGGKPTPEGYWSIRQPDLFFFAEHDGKTTSVCAANLRTGERKVMVKVNRALGDMQPPHPSEEWFLFGDTKGAGRDEPEKASLAYVVGLDGSVQEIRFEKRYHRLRFNKSADRRIFYNFDDPRASFTILPDGTGKTPIPHQGGHPDWTPDGGWLFFNAYEGKVLGVRYDACRYDGSELHTVFPYGGHASATLDGESLVTDGGPESGMISYVRIDKTRTAQTLAMCNTSRYDHSNRWHPQHHSTHPHPNSSPDATKVLWNSDAIAQYTDIYVSISRFPDPPSNLTARRQGPLAELSWKSPRRSLETRGYHVYRTLSSGFGYERLTKEPVPTTQWSGPAAGADAYYVVTAVEHSGLESAPSNEVFEAGNAAWRGFARIHLEAESVQPELPMQEMIGMADCSNGYYLGCRDGKPGGRLLLDAGIPKAGDWIVWARVKGKGSLRTSLGGAPGEIDCTSGVWVWRKAASPVRLPAGTQPLEASCSNGGECVDKFLITDDSSFTPKGRLALDERPPAMPAEVSASALAPNTIHVKWQPAKDSDFDHYNVYCGRTADFKTDQSALVGSPSEPEFVDWGLELNATYFYRVSAVDRAGNESHASAPLKAAAPVFRPVRVALHAAEAKARGMKPFEVAQLGEVALAPAGKEAAAVWEFELPRAGEFAVWGRSTHSAKEPALFDLILDGAVTIPWEALGMWNEWLWSPAGKTTAGTPELFKLAAGRHTLEAKPRTPASKVLGIVVTDNPAWWPVREMKVVGY